MTFSCRMFVKHTYLYSLQNWKRGQKTWDKKISHKPLTTIIRGEHDIVQTNATNGVHVDQGDK